MTEEFSHDELRPGEQVNDSEVYADLKREMEEYLEELVKHIEPGGEKFTPPAVHTEEVDSSEYLLDGEPFEGGAGIVDENGDPYDGAQIYVTPEGVSDPREVDGDLWFILESVSELDEIATNHWWFGEGSGDTTIDQIGDLDGEIEGATWNSNAGRQGYHLDFGDANDEFWVDMGEESQSEFAHFVNNGEGTIGAWINPGSDLDSNGMIVGTNKTTSDNTVNLVYDGDELIGDLSNGEDRVAEAGGEVPEAISDEGWFPVVLRLDGGVMEVFAGSDLDLIASDTIDDTGSGDLGYNIFMGTRAPGGISDVFSGGIDDVWKAPDDVSMLDLENWVNNTSENYE